MQGSGRHMRPFNQGIKAFREGRLDNPYKENTKDHRDWQFGFNKAYFSNLERVQAREQSGTRSSEVQSHQKESA